VLGLQVFFELGLGFVILQTVSHLMADLRLDKHTLLGNPVSLGRLGRLFADALRWYAVVSLLFIAVVLVAGLLIFGREPTSATVAWRATWLVLVPVFGASILTNAVLSILEGLGLVASVAKVRLLQSLLAMSALWLGLNAGLKLASLVAMHSANVLVAILFVLTRHRKLLLNIYRARAPRGVINWRSEIWPFQWRIAVSWTAGYLGSQAITPIVFNQVGAVAAGQLGLSLTLMGAVSSMAMAWVTTKSPTFGRLVAQQRYAELSALYKRAERHAVAAALTATALVVAIVTVLANYWPLLGGRFVTTGAVALLAAATVFNVQISARAVYLRGFRREPFMALSVSTGLGICVAALGLAGPLGTAGVVAAYAGVTIAVAALWARPLFYRCQREYTHA
jgi:hypothetical protein